MSDFPQKDLVLKNIRELPLVLKNIRELPLHQAEELLKLYTRFGIAFVNYRLHGYDFLMEEMASLSKQIRILIHG